MRHTLRYSEASLGPASGVVARTSRHRRVVGLT
jgi:hypothetical protein